MSNKDQLMHAAMLSYEESERQDKLPKPKPVKKEPKFSEMWSNLAYMDGQEKKFDKEAKKYVGKFASAEEEEKYKQ